MNVLDLFSGIGGFSLGLERAGMRTVAFCEVDSYCREVLRKHWPDVPIYGDVRKLRFDEGRLVADADTGHEQPEQEIRAGRQSIDLICGGFPCQDISIAGKGAGLAGDRSGLWSEYARIIGEARPRYVIVENVSALLGRGLERVLGDLAALGYDAEWHCIPAAAAGAPHRRDRIWIVAYPCCPQRGAVGSTHQRLAWAECLSQWQEGSGGSEPSCEDVADASRPHVEGQRQSGGIPSQRSPSRGASWWFSEPDVGRVAHGIPARVDRLRGLGNAVVPQIPEIIGRAIMNNSSITPPEGS
jgi:DNA (cytosine-5)-methyltransferase 1